MRAVNFDSYHRPLHCQECGGIMIYEGIGEYRCENCHKLDYDDYGKVRKYIEQNPGASIAIISDKTGVSRKIINEMVRESRFEIANDSRIFMKCEICGVNIRSGHLCPTCEKEYNRKIEEEIRAKHRLEGYGTSQETGQSGSKRFNREKF